MNKFTLGGAAIAMAALLFWTSNTLAADAYNLNIGTNATYSTAPVVLSCVTDGSSPVQAAPCGNASNPVNISGSIAVTPDANAAQLGTANVAPPTRSEGSRYEPSLDLHGATRTLSCDTGGNCLTNINGSSAVNGDVAAGATDSGNPVKDGCINETTPTAVTTGQRANVHCSTRGEVHGIVRDAAGNNRGANVDASGNLNVVPTSSSATAAAPPASATYVAGNGSGATGGLLTGLKTCDTHAKYDASDNGSITIVTGVSGRKVYICGFILATGGTATNLKLREGSDANCATNAADITPAYQLVANDRVGVMGAFWTGLAVSTNAYFVCVNASAGNAHQAEVFYTIQ